MESRPLRVQPTPSVPGPIDLTPSQWDQVERRIDEFIEESPSNRPDVRKAVARLDVLPLFFDWTAFMALGPDGLVVWVPYDNEPGDVEPVHEEQVRNMGLFQGARLHPGLAFLVPSRPTDAIDCPVCGGTGRVTFPEGRKHLSDVIICSCGGLGWTPPPRKP
jgi:hypothetical protein